MNDSQEAGFFGGLTEGGPPKPDSHVVSYNPKDSLMNDIAEHTIIGGGIAGCSLAYFLAKKGIRDIVLLEKDYLASKETGLCPGGIRQQHTNELCARIAKKSVDEFFGRIDEELHPEYPLPFIQSGYMFLAHTENTLESYRENVRQQNRWGIPSKMLTLQEIQEIVPQINPDGLLGAAFCGTDGFLEDSHGLTQLLGKRIREMGGRILFEEAIDIKVKNEKIIGVQTPERFINTESVINAAGCDAPRVSDWVGVRLPIEIQKRRLLYTVRIEERFLEPLVVALDKGWAGKQLREGNVYMGYLREAEESLSDHRYTEKCVELALQIMPEKMSELRILKIQEGRYDTTPDGQPIIGAVPERKGYTLMTGFSGHGYMLAPAIGMVLSEILTGQRPSLDIERLRLERFQETHMDREKLMI
ncbi:MAG: FAD-dependent oxidoreductase [Thermodesulfobacteriota bacterium]